MKKFSRITAQRLKHYVYLLVDPRSNEVLYVGKASGSTRPFSHFEVSTQIGPKGERNRIAELLETGIRPCVEILRYGLDIKTAHEIEAAVIDAIGVERLDNRIVGHHSSERGRLNAHQIEAKLGGQPLDISKISEPSLLFYRNEAFPENRLYDETRQFWSLSESRICARKENGDLKYGLAFAMRGSFVLEVYRILAWFEAGTTVSSRTYRPVKGKKQWEFIGSVAEPAVRKRYRFKTLMRDNQILHATQIGFRYIK